MKAASHWSTGCRPMNRPISKSIRAVSRIPTQSPTPQGSLSRCGRGPPAMLEFPVVSTGEIDGTVYRGKGEWASAVSDAVIQLVDTGGKVVSEVKSAFDGFYLFSYVRPGTYILRVDPDQAARLNLIAPSPRQIEIMAGRHNPLGRGLRLLGYGGCRPERKQLPGSIGQFHQFIRRREGMVRIVVRIDRGVQWLGADDRRPVRTRPTAPRHSPSTPQGCLRAKRPAICATRVRALRGELWCNPMEVQMR